MVRYYIRVSDKIIWADRPEELMQDLPRPEDLPPGIDPLRPISVTFIRATVFDNPVLLRNISLGCFRCRCSSASGCWAGNWKIRLAAGLYFKREWCAVVSEAPADLDVVRYGVGEAA